MKKFLIGMLSVFLLFGASILSACGSNGLTLTLSKETVEIQIYSGEEEDYQIVTAEVGGTDKASISASAMSGYENIVKVSTSTISDTKVSIKIEGLTEGDAQIAVKSGDVTKYIRATVFSEVSEMTQKTEESGKKNNFLVRGQTNILKEENLIKFTPSEKSRRNITWELAETYSEVSLDGTSLSIGDGFIGDNISLKATTEKDVTTIITLPVLDKIDEAPLMSFSYSKNTTFEEIDETNNSFNIVPNVPDDEKYQGYVLLNYTGDLEITGYALDNAGNQTNEILVNRDGSLGGFPLFAIYANKEKNNINKDYTIGFKIGYAEYNYYADTITAMPIKIVARELVNGVIVSTYGSGNIENSTQTLYTEYGDSEYSTVYGQEFNILMVPTTVINATNKYSITLARLSAGGAVAEGCPIEIWYRDMINGGVWTLLPLIEDVSTGNYITNEMALPSTTTIYIKASNTLMEQSVEGFNLTFTSADNPNISSTFDLKLVRSVSAVDFKFPNGDFKIDSSQANLTLKKQFTLKGQTSIEGLEIATLSKAVTFDKIHYISNDEESVTFEVAVTLNKASYGITTVDNYQITHKNGLVSEPMAIDIFLPLKEAGMFVDNSKNKSNSVIDIDYTDKTYNNLGQVIGSASSESLSELMLKNGTTTPIIYAFNEINGISAVAKLKVEFFDFDPDKDDLTHFISLANTQEGIIEIIQNAKNKDISKIAYFTSDFSSIITNNVGHTYAVISFTGKGTENIDIDGNVTLVRVLRIESLVTPEGMNVYPNVDKNIELYSMESLATSDENLTKKNVQINFVKTNITYKNITNLNFFARSEVMGDMNISGDGDTVSWTKGRYTLSNIKLTDNGITFTVSSLHTFGEHIFTDTLDIHYSIYNFEDNKIYDISTSIKITILNAQRIESVVWDNYDESGLYFELDDNEAQYMLFKTTPTNAKNKNMAYVLTNEEGVAGKTFIEISSTISSNTLSVNLATDLTEGLTGYLYILPSDAIYNNQIKYYYVENGSEKSGYIALSSLGSIINNDGETNYDYLIKNAYFKSNVTAGESKNVEFKNIILKIKVVVADGKSFEHSYRIYDEEGFNTILSDKYYTVMNSIDLDSSRTAITGIDGKGFTGGLQGYNNDVTVKFNGANFANIIAEGAEIRNIKFNGDVKGNGFVADINNGKITNVTVDVNGIQASQLEVFGIRYGGGIVGVNNGTIDGGKVLGLNIEGSNTSIIGGIAGQNKGAIKNSAVEFYNLKTGVDTYGVNKFKGNIVGAMVGEILADSSIYRTYAYDYTLADGSTTFEMIGDSTKKGAFAGYAVLDTNASATIDYSFAVVNQMAFYNNGSYSDEVKLTNYYNSYYFTGDYTVDYVYGYESDSDFVQKTAENFDSEINGGNAYLKELQQPKKVTNVDYQIKTYVNNGYYKSVEVDSTNAILFYYALQSSFVDLNTAEENDLKVLNTITLSQLVGEENISENIIITSSDISIVKVVGSSIILRKTGEITLTLSSKQNVQLNKSINVKIVSPLSEMQISWLDSSENVNYVQENVQISIQKTRSRDFMVDFYRSQVYLGGLANAYDIVQNDYDLEILADIAANAVEIQISSAKEFKLLAHDDSLLTTFTVSPTIFEDEDYQNAIRNEFTRTFKVLPTEGLISFGISGETLTISPSINASVKAEIKTTAETDNIYPVVSLDNNNLTMTKNGNAYYFTILGEAAPILEAVVTVVSNPTTSNGVTTYVFDINFAVAEGYKSNVSQEYQFEVYLMSESGNSSKEWGGKFSILLTQQDFTNIDVSNRKITTPLYKYDNVSGKYVEVYTAEKITGVLAPGNSSILEINVNPEYAYYDYVEFSYSGARVSNAVNVMVVEPFKDYANEFVKKTVENNNIETLNSKLVYRPSVGEKSTIFYKLWINTTVNRDTTLCLTATFYRDGGEVLDLVNYYLTVSYLTEPQITVDGASTTYLAKGSSANIQIDVLLDQKVDSLILEGQGLQGISVSQLSKPISDLDRGVKTYTAKVYANVFASTSDNNTFYLRARVSRELNGAKEIKDSIATVVIVDFKIDTKNIAIENAKDGNLTIWQGVSRPLMVKYNLLPESYPYPSTKEMADAIEGLRSARESFEMNEYYPSTVTADTKYLINYIYDKDLGYVKQSFYQRLFLVINNEYYPVSDTSIEKPFDVIEDTDGKISLRGTKVSGSIKMVLKTYISSNYVTQTIETPFTVKVEAYSDPDLPIKISNAKEFNNLNPEHIDEGVAITQNDYILENDIVLENYTSFNTDLISSLDGNGHTIFIKSYNFDETSKTLNLALFNIVKEGTTLKNVRVNLYNGGQITINVSKFNDINIAGLAIENAGVITNCEVVSFYTSDTAAYEALQDTACTIHKNPQGINVNYVSANGTDSVYLPDNASWSSQVAGFVIENTGSITNSRVGGDEIIIVGAEKLVDNEPTGYTYASTLKLDTFNIVAQGNIAGFVLSNISGYITSSYVKNVDIENQSNSITFFTAGFVGTNNSSILTSYVEGAPSIESNMPKGEYSKYAFEGTSIRSRLGYIAGFIYENEGSIKDSYSNILISNSIDATRVYYASGFVYLNEGQVENCYSASQIANSKFSQMNFSGVSESGDLLNNGKYINCYFFNKAYENSESADDFTTESQYDTGAQLISKPNETSAFYGFAIADGEEDGIWRSDDERGIALIEADKTTISNRYTQYVNEKDFEGIAAEDSLGRKYILPYSVLTFVGSSRAIDTTLGSDFNPILILDAQDFLEISGTSKSTYVQQYFNDKAIWGSYRVVNNINLLDIANGEDTVALPSSNKAFAGRLYGNGFIISGISITADDTGVAFGLFKSIEKRGTVTPIVTNLDLEISQVIAGDVVMVGGLAGYIKHAIIINIDLQFKNDNSIVTGLNFVGGLAGLASGNNVIKNISMTNPSAIAERRADEDETNQTYFKTANELHLFRIQLENNLNFNTSIDSYFVKNLMTYYSYAGSLIGFVDNYSVDNYEFNINQVNNKSINNVRVNGKINVQGQVVGGVIGLTGYQTHVNDIGLTIDATAEPSKILSTKHFAGGVIGQSFGGVSRTFAIHDKTTQDSIEDGMSTFYQGTTSAPRGQLDIFSSGDTNYTQEYIGGLIGYVGSGKLEVSYSKLNVTSSSAKYAGGVIGGIEVSEALIYKTDSDKAAEPAYTRYFINEVYATGDVRANINDEGFAGGLIGVIKGENSSVALLAVNAFNYITSYDYETGVYQSLANSLKNISSIIKVNSLVGHLIKFNYDADGEIESETVDVVDTTNYSSYLVFMKAGESTTSESESVTVRPVSSVGYYESFYSDITLNIFSSIDGIISDDNTLYKEELVYAISAPINYVNSSIGHTYTQVGFINSGAWRSDTWIHPFEDLFPSIKYKRAYNVVFLDQYNIKEVFAKMTGGNVRVIVRGRITEGSEACGDISLIDYFKDNPNGQIEEFAGILEGGKYKIVDVVTGEKRDVKIITDRPFIKSTAAGFTTNKVTIDYIGTGTEGNKFIDINGGLFSEDAISDANIADLTINLNSPTRINLTRDNSRTNIGLIAPQITNTSIMGLNINATTEEALAALVQVTSEEIKSLTEVNIGLIAGYALQNSTVSSMYIEDVNLTTGDIISLSKSEVTNVNIGTYFGKIERDPEAQSMAITFKSVTNSSDTSGAIGDTRGHILISENTIENLYLGGYIGKSFGVGMFSFDIESKNDVEIDYLVSNVKETNVYVGGIISTLDAASINGASSSVGASIKSTVYIYNDPEVESLYAGGVLASQLEGTNSDVSISNFNSIDFDIVGGEEIVYSPDKESLEGNYDFNKTTNKLKAQYVKTSKARVGGVVGQTKGNFTYKANTTINDEGECIRILSDDIVAGSVLGEAESAATIEGNIISGIEFMLYNTTENKDVVIGGMLGQSLTGNVTIKGGIDGLAMYNGAVYSNCKNLTFGGMLGIKGSSTGYVNIQNTSFGGVVKVYGDNSQNANIITGGTIGDIPTVKARIAYNYNYGDVFVEYVEYGEDSTMLTELSSYKFGGIIGESAELDFDGSLGEEGKTESCEIVGNYSLVTSHNTRYSTATNATAHALFGEGNPWGSNQSISKSNYYNHATTLLIDNLGVDAGNTRKYDSTSLVGYGEYSIEAQVASDIKDKLGNQITINGGHKLTPASLEAMGEHDETTFHGLYYYSYGAPSRQLSMKVDGEEVKEFKNVAIIGSGENNLDNYTSSDPLIYKLTGYSFISGITRNIQVEKEEVVDRIYAPLVQEMSENAMVYAVNITGKYEIGGGQVVELAGIVGNFQSGKIFDCSTDIDLVYRAGLNAITPATIYGLANSIDDSAKEEAKNFKLIENSYTGGSISTMVKANIYAFTNGTEKTNIKNCYTYTKLSPKDYFNAETQVGTIGSFGGAKLTKCYYDIDGFDYVLTEKKGIQSNRSKLRAGGDIWANDIVWTCDVDFNFGYPTLGYNHANVSSYVKYDDETLQCEGIHEHSNAVGAERIYDCYVKTNSYSRYANGIRPAYASDLYYYYIPNGSVLYNVGLNDTENNINVKGYVLRYDIDLSVYSSTNENLYNKADSDIYDHNASNIQRRIEGDFWKKFDGQNKTIKSSTNSLFEDIFSGGSVVNLRLMDVEITNAPALANDISLSSIEISNLTLSGNVTYSLSNKDGGAYGGVANSVTGTGVNINTITNMINLVVKNEVTDEVAENKIGGMFGQVDGGATIMYCSNYGPVRNSESGEGWTDYVGGVVGYMADKETTISYSYNTTSVLGNYASSSSALSVTSGRFCTGGIVGYMANGTISDSYNSGMIKSGNKANETSSYAGGLIGYAAKGILKNLYNEGTVEALAQNPTYKVGKNSLSEELQLHLIGGRNVWAYGIGYVTDKVMPYGFLTTYITKEAQDKSIHNNGNPYAQNIILQSWTTEEAYGDYATADYNRLNGFGQTYETMTACIKCEKYWGEKKTNVCCNHISISTQYKFGYCEYHYGKAEFPSTNHIRRYEQNIKDGEPAEYSSEQYSLENLVVASYYDYGLPNRMIVPISKNVILKNRYEDWFSNAVYYVVSFVKEYGIADFNLEDEYVKSQFINKDVTNLQTENYSGFKRTTNSLAGSEVRSQNTSIKEMTRSRQSSNSTETIKISGNDFYVADSHNQNTIFNAGVFKRTQTVTFSNIKYIEDPSVYTLSVEGDYKLKVISIEQTKDSFNNVIDNSVDVKFDIYIEEKPGVTEIPAELNFELKLDYQDSIEFDLSSMKYFANDEYSFGMEINDFNPTAMKDYTLSHNFGGEVKTYEEVVKVSTEAYNCYKHPDGSVYPGNPEVEDNPPSDLMYVMEPENDDDETFIYLAIDESGRYIYVPHATLNYASGSNTKSITVNESSYIEAGKKLDYENTTSLINHLFAGKTMYYRIASNSYKELPISGLISDYAKASVDIKGTDKFQANPTLSIGKNFTITNSVVMTELGTYKLSFTNLPAEKMLALNGTTPVLSFNGSVLGLAGSTMNINGVEYTATIENKSIILVGETPEDQSQNIKAYFNGLTYIGEDNSKKSVSYNDKFSGIENGTKTIYLQDEESAEVIGSVKQTITKDWYLGSNPINEGTNYYDKYLITKNGYNLSISLNNAAVTLYTLNGIIIYYDSISPDIKEEYNSKYEELKIYTKSRVLVDGTFVFGNYGTINNHMSPTEDLYTEYSLTINGIVQGQGLLQITTGDSTLYPEVTGDLKLELTFFSTYQEKSLSKNETGEYTLLLEDKSDNFVYKVDVGYDEGTSSYVTKNISQIVKYSSGLSYSIDREIIEVEATEDVDGNITRAHTEIRYSINNDENNIVKYYPTIDGNRVTGTDNEGNVYDAYLSFTVRIYEDGKAYYLSMSKENLEKLVDEGSEDGEDIPFIERRIVTHWENESFWNYIPDVYGLVNAGPEVNIKDAIIVLEKKIEEGKFDNILTRTVKDDHTYISSNSHKILNSYSDNFYVTIEDEEGNTKREEVNITTNSVANCYIFNWIEFDMPSYSLIEKDVYVDGCDVKTENDSYFEIADDKYKIYLKCNSDKEVITETLSMTKTQEDTYCDEEGTPINTNHTIDPLPIILTKDISFNNVGFMNNANIIGNGYYISYYNSPFFDTLEGGNNQYIRDVSFLAETNNNMIFGVAKTGEVITNQNTYIGLSFYGSITNLKSSTIITDTDIAFKNINIYVSVNGYNTMYLTHDTPPNLSIFTNSSKIENLKNYGTIIGDDGKKGSDGLSTGISLLTTKGTNGQVGQSISVAKDTATLNSVVNNGIVKPGNGGNAGAGGSYGNDAFKNSKGYKNLDEKVQEFADFKEYKNNSNPDAPVVTYGKDAGEKGIAGTVSQFASCISSSDGKTAQKGATTRSAAFWQEQGFSYALSTRTRVAKNKMRQREDLDVFHFETFNKNDRLAYCRLPYFGWNLGNQGTTIYGLILSWSCEQEPNIAKSCNDNYKSLGIETETTIASTMYLFSYMCITNGEYIDPVLGDAINANNIGDYVS